MSMFQIFCIVTALAGFPLLICSSLSNVSFSFVAQCAPRACLNHTQFRTRSRLECATACATSSGCSSFVFVPLFSCSHISRECFLNESRYQETDVISCHNKYDFTNLCLNGGVWSTQQQTCTCKDGWVGTWCNRLPYSCKELITHGYPIDDYRIDIDVYRNMSRIVPARCEISDGWYRTFIFTSDGTTQYNETWASYVNGFKQGLWNFWLGLENVLAFNRMGHTNISFAVVIQGGDFMWEYKYINFRIEDATQGYRFSCDFLQNKSYGQSWLSTYYTLSDVLSVSMGRPFSTRDMNKHSIGENCSALYGAGWWYGRCTPGQHLSPLGLNPASAPTANEMNKIWLPGLNTSDMALMNGFSSVFLSFIN